MDKFKDKYRIPSARASWWDYSSNGCYFITICTAKHVCLFGDIVNNVMHLSDIGKIVDEEWKHSFTIRNELFCDAYVIMPNHIHAILWIETPPLVETHGMRLGYGNNETHAMRLYRVSRSVSSFVAGFKGAVTKRINMNYYPSGTSISIWQTRFHDRVIRNATEYERILNYIHANPCKWADDKFHPPL